MKEISVDSSTLGKKVNYNESYDKSLLFKIDRKTKRDEINIDSNSLPFFGYDLWTCYEISWLNKKGKPISRILSIFVPCTSHFISESKSLKLYFNSFNQTQFENEDQVLNTISDDLNELLETEVVLSFREIDFLENSTSDTTYHCIDNLDVEISEYIPNPQLISFQESKVKDSVVSHLFKSNCLVTNQPDWASLFIQYHGHQINHESLLKYIISFRKHNEFHEQCVERIFKDLWDSKKLDSLIVYARFTRRGGIDINPLRSSEKISSYDELRINRQ